MEWQLKRKNALVDLLLDDDAKEYISDELHDVVVDKRFWEQLQHVIELVKPISRGTDQMQGEECISIVYYVFSEWEKHYGDKKFRELLQNDKDTVLDSVAERWNLISDFVHPASFMLDPRFRSYDMEIEQINDGETYLKGA